MSNAHSNTLPKKPTACCTGTSAPNTSCLASCVSTPGSPATFYVNQASRLSAVREALVLHVSASSPPPPEIAAFLFPHHERAERFDGVYVMTALDGPSPGRRATTDDAGVSGGGASFGTIDFRTRADRPPDGRVHSIGPISMSGATLSEFVRMLEGFLGRPIVDDSGLTGRFDIELRGQYDDPETLTAALRDQLGLVLNRALS